MKRLCTRIAMLDGIVQVRAATVIEDCESAEIVPFAELFSTAGFGRQVPGPISTADPPADPPILPALKPPVELKLAEMFASNLADGVRAWPFAKPASAP